MRTLTVYCKPADFDAEAEHFARWIGSAEGNEDLPSYEDAAAAIAEAKKSCDGSEHGDGRSGSFFVSLSDAKTTYGIAYNDEVTEVKKAPKKKAPKKKAVKRADS